MIKKNYAKKLFEMLNTTAFDDFYTTTFNDFISGQLEIDESISFEEARDRTFREFQDLLSSYVEK
jgi:hypothetical protein